MMNVMYLMHTTSVSVQQIRETTPVTSACDVLACASWKQVFSV
jgi:hypothetical protein